MKYITVFDTPQQNQITIIRHLFEQHQIDFRIFDESTNAAIPVGVTVQVEENQVEKARSLLKENGFMGTPTPGPEGSENKNYWIFLVVALLAIIAVSILVNWLI